VVAQQRAVVLDVRLEPFVFFVFFGVCVCVVSERWFVLRVREPKHLKLLAQLQLQKQQTTTTTAKRNNNKTTTTNAYLVLG
jgi:hypothetical protein